MPTPAAIKAQALAIGFDRCGIAAAEAYPELGALRGWLARGYAGEMAYLARTADRRADVRHVLPSARSVIVTATVYNTARPYSTEIDDPGVARIARYAWGDDYHEIIAERLDQLVAWMRNAAPEPFEARAYVDTGPVQERVFAQHAGIGWIGKNTCVIDESLGSWMFLSVILCSLDLPPDLPATDRCGSCTRCLDACPTGALTAPAELDARRCISYLTIELKTDIPAEHRQAIGSHIFGCDICQDVCPWNRRAPESADPAWQPRPAFDGARLADLWRQDDDRWRETLRHSPLKRPKLTGLRRNLAIALGNAAAAGDEDSRRVTGEATSADEASPAASTRSKP